MPVNLEGPSGAAIEDADVPAAIARDAEVAALIEAASVPQVAVAVGEYLGPRGWIGNLTLMNLNGGRGGLIVVNRSMTFDRIGVQVQTAGGTGAKMRLALYSLGVAGDETPALVADYGQVDVDSTGRQELTISETLAPGVYVPTGIVQGTFTGDPVIRGLEFAGAWPKPYDVGASDTAGFSVFAPTSGAAPASGSRGQVTNVPIVSLRRA